MFFATSSVIGYLGLLILDAVSLINDHVPPIELLEGSFLPEHHLVGGHNYIPLTRENLLLDDTCLWVAYSVCMCVCVM